MKRTALAALAAAFAVASTFAQDDLLHRALRHVPSDAGTVLVTQDMSAVSRGFAAFADAAGLKDLAETDPLRWLAGPFEPRQRGVDPDGVVVAVFRPRLLIGVLRDEKAFAQEAGAESTPDGIVRFAANGRDLFGARSGRIVILGFDRLAVQAALRAEGDFLHRFQPHADRLMERGQITLLLNVDAFRPLLEPMLDVAQGFFEMGASFGRTPQEVEPSLAMWRWMFSAAHLLLKDSTIYAGSGTFRADGIVAQDLLAVDPAGRVASYLRDVRKSDRDPLQGLPAADATFAFGCDWTLAEGRMSLNEQLLNAMLSARALSDDEPTRAALEAGKRVYQNITGYNGVMKLNGAQPGLVAYGLYATAAPDTVIDAIGASMKLLASTKLMSMSAADLSVSIAEREDTIGKTPIHAFDMQFDSKDPQIIKMLGAVYGAHPSFRLAPHPLGVAYAMGSDGSGKDALTSLLDPGAARLVGDPRVQAARSDMTPQPQASILVDLRSFVQFGLRTARAMGAPAPEMTQPPAPSPYAALNVYLDQDALRGQVLIPSAAIRAVVEAFQPEKDGE